MANVGVRPARHADAEAVADIQVRAWRADYGAFVPAAVLGELTGAEAREVWRHRWTEAVAAPPSPRHLLLVAVAGETVVGFAACGPAGDADHDPETTAEIITLRVDPGHDHDGHDSRLLAAAADLLRDHGFTTLITWLFEADEAQRAFFVSAGWAPDGARRTLSFPTAGSSSPAEAPQPAHQTQAVQATDAPATASASMIRLHTDITPQEDPGEELGRR